MTLKHPRPGVEKALNQMAAFFSPEQHALREARHWERMAEKAEAAKPLEDLLPDVEEEEDWAAELLGGPRRG